MSTPIERIQPRGGPELLYRAQLSPEEAYLFTRISGPMTLKELAGICGKKPEELLPLLERLERAGLLLLWRREPEPSSPSPLPSPPPPQTPIPQAPPRVHAPPARVRKALLPAEQVFGKGDPLAGTTPVPPALWVSTLYQAMIERRSSSYFLRYPDGEIFALFLKDGAFAHYLCNRNDDQLKIGKIIQKVSGFPDEEIHRVLAWQKEKGGKFGEILIKLGKLTPKELQQALIFQFKWVIRELVLKGVPAEAGAGAERTDYDDSYRFFLSPWMLQISRRMGSRLAQGNWDEGWKQVRWRTNPLGVLGLKISDLTAEERTLYRELSSPRGVNLDTITPVLRTFVFSGIIEPILVEKEAGELPHWVSLTHKTPFALLGLHWSALPHEVESAVEGRKKALMELFEKALLTPAQKEAVQKELEQALKLLLNEQERQKLIAAEASSDKRDNMLHIFVDQGMNALLLAQDYKEAQEVGERLLFCSFDLPQHRAAAHYILARSLEKQGRVREANFHAARLQELAGKPQAPGEVHVFLAYFYRDQGNQKLAQVEIAKALAKNPGLKRLF